MTRFFQIAAFEFRTRSGRLSSAVYFAVFFAMSFLWMAAAGGAFPDADIGFGSAHLSINSPYALARLIVVLTAFAMIVVAAVMGRAVQEDIETRMATFFATAPISKGEFLAGRFLGAYGVVLLILLAIPLGALTATALPTLDAARLSANHLYAYALPYLLLTVPDALVIGSIFFFLAALSKRMLPVYVGSVLLLIVWIGSAQWVHDLDQRSIVALIDPFGSRALGVITQYWTAPERNARHLALQGVLLENRLLWLALGLFIAACGTWRFSLPGYARVTQGTRRLRPPVDAPPPILPAVSPSLPPESRLSFIAQLLPLALMDLRSILANVYFGVLVLAGVALAIAMTIAGGRIYGTATWPVTFQMIDLVSEPFVLFMLIIITFYAGELIWHERDARIDQIVDASAVPSPVLFLAKLIALMIVPALLQLVLMFAGIAVQLSHGYHRLQLGLYLHDLFGIQLIDLWFLCALALTVHALVNHKYLSHFLLVVFYIALISSSGLGFEDNLYKFGETADIVYSDMNGFGHALVAERAFELYWAAFCVPLLLLGYLAMRRGTPASFAERVRAAQRRISPFVLTLGAIGLAGFIGMGGFIFYNTHILNEYRTTQSELRGQADYEKTYRKLLAMGQPKITSVKLFLALDPDQRSLVARGTYQLLNRTDAPIDTLNVDFPSDRNIILKRLSTDRKVDLITDDRRLGMRQLRLSQALAPGAATRLDFEIVLTNPGFAAGHEETALVQNGSFFNGRLILPHIGYDPSGELERAADRKKYGLPARAPMRAQDDPVGLRTSYIADDADLIDFSADISTSPDQLAVAPGHLTSAYVKDGRAHFVYRSSLPILNFYAFQSARYAQRRDVWKGPNGDVPLEIDYQPGHEFDLSRMFAAAKDALAYNSANFAPYQYKEFRIVEFPRYQLFAESFPNTTPYSEGIGFIARVNDKDPKDIDYPYFVTAHEVSHQWWGYQLVGANVQGATMLSESLAQYSALMVLKHRYGDARMRRFLAFELDTYLSGRANENEHEVPLEKVENQTYLHYAKGSLVMYALQDALGEDTVDRVLAQMLKDHATMGPPYPTSTELVQRFKAAAPDDLKNFVTDLFERIVLFDNRALEVKSSRLASGEFQTTVKVHAEKRLSDGLGNETLAALDDWIDVGILNGAGDAIALKKVHFTSGEAQVTFVTKSAPVSGGIDPLHKLIDRTPAQNTMLVQFE